MVMLAIYVFLVVVCTALCMRFLLGIVRTYIHASREYRATIGDVLWVHQYAGRREAERVFGAFDGEASFANRLDLDEEMHRRLRNRLIHEVAVMVLLVCSVTSGVWLGAGAIAWGLVVAAVMLQAELSLRIFRVAARLVEEFGETKGTDRR